MVQKNILSPEPEERGCLNKEELNFFVNTLFPVPGYSSCNAILKKNNQTIAALWTISQGVPMETVEIAEETDN